MENGEMERESIGSQRTSLKINNNSEAISMIRGFGVSSGILLKWEILGRAF